MDICSVIIPFVPAFGASLKVIGFVDDAHDMGNAVEAFTDSSKIVDDFVDTVETFNIYDSFSNTIKYTDKAIKQMNNFNDLNHSFPCIFDSFLDFNDAQKFIGGDGSVYYSIMYNGYINDHPGNYEYIFDRFGNCNHRFFREIK